MIFLESLRSQDVRKLVSWPWHPDSCTYVSFVWANILVWESGNPRERFGLSSILLFSTLMPKSCLAMVTTALVNLYIHSPPYFHLGRHLMHLVQLQHLMHLMHLLYHLMMHLHLFTLASSAPPRSLQCLHTYHHLLLHIKLRCSLDTQ